jgi:CMP/dCMP kinase
VSVPPVIIAIDGPAGAGKSTIARELARRLGFVLLDTGALYRAIALAAKRRALAWEDEANVAALAEALAARGELALEPSTDPARAVRVVLAGEDVSAAIREPDISMGASRVSAIGAVRGAILALQRDLARQPGQRGAVAEGRDMGTVVFPDAQVKFFVTASLDERARRRQDELSARGATVALETTRAEVAQRDKQDSERAVAPLRQAEDARLVDTSARGVEEIVAEMLAAIAAATP